MQHNEMKRRKREQNVAQVNKTKTKKPQTDGAE